MKGNPVIHRMFTVVATFAFCVASVSAQQTIERLAPENTILVMGVKNVQSMMDRTKATPMWTLWQSEQMKKLRADAMEQMGKGLDTMLEELGVEKDSLVHPTGSAGLAVFAVTDENGLPQPAMLAFADYGDAAKADKTSTLIQAALERGEKDNQLEFESREVDGRTIYSIDLSKMKPQDDDEAADDFNPQMFPMPQPDEMLEGIEKLHYVRDGHSFIASTDLTALTDALENIAAKAAGGRVSDRAEYQAALSSVGEADVYGALLTRDVMDLLAAQDEMGMMDMLRPMVRTLFGEVQAYGFGMRVDGSKAMVEQTISAYMPNGKAGVTKLMDMPLQQGAVPAFVGPDAVSYTAVSFKFSGLMDVIRQVVNSNPMMAAQFGPQIDAIAPQVTQITSALGNQMQWSTSVTKPFTADSTQKLMAIECPKPQDFENAFAQMAGDAGIESRDFLGQRIYTMDEDMMMMMPMEAGGPVSLGIGGGFVLIGPTSAVEQGLRATSQPGGASLASSSEFQRAIATLSKDGVVAWGYTDTIDSMEASLAAQREQIESMIKQMREEAEMWGDEDADIKGIQDRMEERMRESMKMWNDIDFNLLRQHIGPSAWEVRSTENGFVMRAYMLSASSK